MFWTAISYDRSLLLWAYYDYALLIITFVGVSLSGGQRARINLARAIYKEADIYLLDDPLSAVDTHVGKQLFEDCICCYLKSKCVVLVTHQLQYLKNVSCIYLLEDSKVTASGTYQQLKASDSEFVKLLAESKEEERKAEEERRKSRTLQESKSTETQQEDTPTQEKEHRASGSISGTVYKSYLKAGGGLCVSTVLFVLCILSQIFASSTDYFITLWYVRFPKRNLANWFICVNFRVNAQQWITENPREYSRNSTNWENITAVNSTNIDKSIKSLFIDVVSANDHALAIYSGLLGLTIILTVSRSLGFFRYCMTASTNLHNGMFNKIVFSPMSFFNNNPSGRILNRFSKDIGNIDETLPLTMIDTIQVS